MNAQEARKKVDDLRAKKIKYVSLVNIYSAINKAVESEYYSVIISGNISETDLCKLNELGYAIEASVIKCGVSYSISWYGN